MDDYRQYLRATLGGDRNAFEEVVRRFWNMAFFLADQRLGRIGRTEDAVQEAFLTAYLQLSQLNSLQAFPAWFRTILRSCINKAAREREPHLSLSEVDESLLKADIPPDPETTLLRFQNKAMVARTLNSLDGVLREACVQRYIYGLPYKDIAAVLGVPVGTIKRRLHSARERVLAEFNREGRPVIRVGYLPITDHLLAMVSHHGQARTDFEIHLKRYLSWSCLVLSLERGLLDAAFIMAPLAVALRNRGVPILYVLDCQHDGSAITLPREGAAKTLLTVKRMGLPHLISTHRILLANLVGPAPDRPDTGMTAQYINPSYLIRSLASRRIDAFFCAEPWNSRSVFEGSGRIYALSKDLYPGHMCCILVVTEQFAAKKGAVLRAYVKALAAAGQYISSNPNRAALIQARYTGVPAPVAEWALKHSGVSFQDLSPDLGRLKNLISRSGQPGLMDRLGRLDTFLHPVTL
ncbi:MAG: sigma-70 family RNA polymerase sigma factor [Thermodesulfobacteriota bacterium]